MIKKFSLISSSVAIAIVIALLYFVLFLGVPQSNAPTIDRDKIAEIGASYIKDLSIYNKTISPATVFERASILEDQGWEALFYFLQDDQLYQLNLIIKDDQVIEHNIHVADEKESLIVYNPEPGEILHVDKVDVKGKTTINDNVFAKIVSDSGVVLNQVITTPNTDGTFVISLQLNERMSGEQNLEVQVKDSIVQMPIVISL